VGPALGQHGINIGQFVKQFNDDTRAQAGLIIPVIITVYKDRTFTLQYKSPPASVLLKKAATLATAAQTPGSQIAGQVTKAQVREIAQAKAKDLNTANVEAAMRMVEGTARSCGIQVVD
jgi:large subunit ribosomal protein L11